MARNLRHCARALAIVRAALVRKNVNKGSWFLSFILIPNMENLLEYIFIKIGFHSVEIWLNINICAVIVTATS